MSNTIGIQKGISRVFHVFRESVGCDLEYSPEPHLFYLHPSYFVNSYFAPYSEFKFHFTFTVPIDMSWRDRLMKLLGTSTPPPPNKTFGTGLVCECLILQECRREFVVIRI